MVFVKYPLTPSPKSQKYLLAPGIVLKTTWLPEHTVDGVEVNVASICGKTVTDEVNVSRHPPGDLTVSFTELNTIEAGLVLVKVCTGLAAPSLLVNRHQNPTRILQSLSYLL